MYSSEFIIFLLVLLFSNLMADNPCPTGMVFVKGGSFMMGCTKEQAEDCLQDETPEYNATVSDFCIGQALVTLKEWYNIMGDGYKIGNGIGNNHPVTDISWDDTQKYFQRLNKQAGKQYRLPTETEWEYAARGGSESKGYKYSGSDSIDKVAWYESNSESKTHEVCQKARNELGLCDMNGNVSEWVSDIYFSIHIDDTDCVVLRHGKWDDAAGVCRLWHRVIRGGSWKSNAKFCRVSSRGPYRPNESSDKIGFRIALTPNSKKKVKR